MFIGGPCKARGLLRERNVIVEGIGLKFACNEFRTEFVGALLPALVLLFGCIYVCVSLQGVEFLPWEVSDHGGQAHGVVGIIACAASHVRFSHAGESIGPDSSPD